MRFYERTEVINRERADSMYKSEQLESDDRNTKSSKLSSIEYYLGIHRLFLPGKKRGLKLFLIGVVGWALVGILSGSIRHTNDIYMLSGNKSVLEISKAFAVIRTLVVISIIGLFSREIIRWNRTS